MKGENTATKSLKKTLKLIDVMKYEKNGISVSNLSEKLDMPVATTYRILSTLTEYSYLNQDVETKKYRLGLKFLDISRHILDGIDLRKQAHPYMTDLAKQTEETCHLSVMEDNEVIYIDRVECLLNIRSTFKIGLRVMAHLSASGKAMMSHLPTTELELLINNLDFALGTKYSLKSKQALLKELASVKEQGFAIDNEEFELGGRCIGVAILDNYGYPWAAISLSGPSNRLSMEYLKNELSKPLIKAAKNIPNYGFISHHW